MPQVFGKSYILKIGRNQELIDNVKYANPIPYDPRAKANTIFDILTDYTYEDTSVTVNSQYADAISGNAPVADSLHNNITIIPPQSISIDNLHITVSITDNKGTKNKSTQMAQIKIYNADDDQVEFTRVGDAVILHAGWKQDGEVPPLLYVGQIESVFTSWQGVDKITHITASPTKLLEDMYINRSYARGFTLKGVLEDLLKVAASKGIPTGKFYTQDSTVAGHITHVLTQEYPFGIAVEGHLLDVIEKLCSENFFKSTVVKGKLYIQPNTFVQYTKIVNVTPDNIKGDITKKEEAQNKPMTAKGTGKGNTISIKLNLNAHIDTNTGLRLRGTAYDGDYQVESCVYDLGYEQGPWDVTITAITVQ